MRVCGRNVRTVVIKDTIECKNTTCVGKTLRVLVKMADVLSNDYPQAIIVCQI